MDDADLMDALDASPSAASTHPTHAMERRPALHGAAEFISWTWEMINDGYADVRWSADGTEIVVLNPERMQANIIPIYFRHGQYSSWVRALNAYNFKKTRPGQWQHQHFQRGKPELLRLITRQPRKKPDRSKPAAVPAAVDPVAPAPHQLTERAESFNPKTWELLRQEREKVGWMREQLHQLEAQLRAAQEEEFAQREDAERIGAFLWSEMRALAPPRMHRDLARLAAPYLSAQDRQKYLAGPAGAAPLPALPAPPAAAAAESTSEVSPPRVQEVGEAGQAREAGSGEAYHDLAAMALTLHDLATPPAADAAAGAATGAAAAPGAPCQLLEQMRPVLLSLYPEMQVDEAVQAVASKCNGCAVTALELKRLCGEWVDICAEHLRICAENNKESDTRVCDQIRGAMERLRLDNSPENRAQVAAELAEAMNMAELSELARDPDIQALLQEG